MNASEREKKRKELAYLEEARRVSPIFPGGDIILHEQPDFLLRGAAGIPGVLGIEMTELCAEQERADGAKLSKVADKAKALYNSMPDAFPVDVGAAFRQPTAHMMRFNELASSLAEFVYAHRNSVGTSFREGLPKGFSHIALFGVRNAMDATRRWRAGAAFDVARADRELLAGRIEDKNRRLPEYRAAAPEVWLLIVNDQFLGHGEVYARPDDLGGWSFPFDFDKVLLFSREPGGRGMVIEVQREIAGRPAVN